MKKLKRQLKTKEVLCTTVINELKAVRKELADACQKRDQLSLEMDLVTKQMKNELETMQTKEKVLAAQIAKLEEERRNMLTEVRQPCCLLDMVKSAPGRTDQRAWQSLMLLDAVSHGRLSLDS